MWEGTPRTAQACHQGAGASHLYPRIDTGSIPLGCTREALIANDCKEGPGLQGVREANGAVGTNGRAGAVIKAAPDLGN